MKKAIILGLLLCSTLLVGCSNNKKSKDTSKESKVEKTSKKEASVSKSSSEIKSSEATEQDNSKTTSTDSDKSKPVETEQDFNYDAIAKGDYSSAAGVWKNGSGSSFVLNNDGTGTMTTESGYQQTFEIQNFNVSAGVGNYTPTNAKEPMGGAAAMFIKIAGNDTLIQNVASDKTRPRIHIGQGEPTGSDQIYYRAN